MSYCRSSVFSSRKLFPFSQSCRSAFLLFVPLAPGIQLTDHVTSFSFWSFPLAQFRAPNNWIIEIQSGFPTSNTFSMVLPMFYNTDQVLVHYSNMLNDSQIPSIYFRSFIIKLFSHKIFYPPALLSI